MTQTPTIGTNRQPPNLNPSPKTRFRESGDNISKHKALLEMREFDRAIDYAFMQYQADLAARCADANGAMAMGLKLCGAHEFVQTLRTLTEVAKVLPVPQDDNLRHS